MQLCGTGDRRVEVVDLEPEEHAVAVRPVSRVADRPMTVLHLEAVELEDQHTVRAEALVLPATVGALASEQSLVPLAARLDIRDKVAAEIREEVHEKSLEQLMAERMR